MIKGRYHLNTLEKANYWSHSIPEEIIHFIHMSQYQIQADEDVLQPALVCGKGVTLSVTISQTTCVYMDRQAGPRNDSVGIIDFPGPLGRLNGPHYSPGLAPELLMSL